MIRIVQATNSKEQKRFLDFPLKLYKGNPYFVPALYMDEKAIFKKDYYYNQTSESIFFNAYDDKKMVGRIQGIIQHAANDKWGQKRVRFTRFDSIDNQEVANALFEAVVGWAKAKGMTEIVGPLGYSDMEREGLLIEGFDQPCTYEEQYNYDYYQELIENYGFEKDVDWLEHQLRAPKTLDPKLEQIVDWIMKKGNYRFAQFKTVKEILDRYEDKFFDLVDEAYSNLYGTVPFFESQRNEIVKAFKLIIDPKFVRLIVDKDDNLAALGLAFPAIGPAMQVSGGHLTPCALIKLWRCLKHPKVLDLGLVGISEKYGTPGLSSAIFVDMMKLMNANGIEHCETNLNLEDNKAIQNNWKRFDAVQNKRRRCFKKAL